MTGHRNRLIILALLALAACRRPAVVTPPLVSQPAGLLLHVPHATRAPDLSLKDDEPSWHDAAMTGPWSEPGSQIAARPYSHARVLWDEQNLYLSLYAADQDICAPETRHDGPLWLHDAFSLRLRADTPDAPVFAVDIAPTGTVTDMQLLGRKADPRWESLAKVAMDVDGTVNDPSGEDDEEWVAFIALPWKQVGIRAVAGTRVRLHLQRCDVPKDGKRRCGQWGQGSAGEPGGTLVLDAGL
jgi:hypothetical protein